MGGGATWTRPRTQGQQNTQAWHSRVVVPGVGETERAPSQLERYLALSAWRASAALADDSSAVISRHALY